MLRVILSLSTDHHFPKQQQYGGLCNGDAVCLVRSRGWTFKHYLDELHASKGYASKIDPTGEYYYQRRCIFSKLPALIRVYSIY
jgi:hypothetical protein